MTFLIDTLLKITFSEIKLKSKMSSLEKFIEKYPDREWNLQEIWRNPNIDIEFIENNQDLPWDWDYVSRNPNITIAYVEKHRDKNLTLLSFIFFF